MKKCIFVISILISFTFSIYSQVLNVTTEPPKLEIKDQKLITQYLNYYKSRGRSSMEKGIYYSGFFSKNFRKIFREENVPEDLYLLFLFNKVWAKGDGRGVRPLWRFDKKTSEKYGLQINKYLDERRSFEKATRATAHYLHDLYEKYDKNWETAIGAYFIGERNINKAIKKAKTKDYWKLWKYLPKETRLDVPNLLATILISNDVKSYGFDNVRCGSEITYDNVKLQKLTKISSIAELTNVSVEYLYYLNPELRSDVSPGEPYNIRVPLGKAEKVNEFFTNRKKNI